MYYMESAAIYSRALKLSETFCTGLRKMVIRSLVELCRADIKEQLLLLNPKVCFSVVCIWWKF